MPIQRRPTVMGKDWHYCSRCKAAIQPTVEGKCSFCGKIVVAPKAAPLTQFIDKNEANKQAANEDSDTIACVEQPTNFPTFFEKCYKNLK